MEKEYDVIILGAGPAGCTAGIYCAAAGLATLVLDKLGPGGQMIETERIENYPGFPNGIDGFSLGQQMKEGVLRAGGFYRNAEISEVSLTEKQKKLSGKDAVFSSEAVIIAAGASPRKAGIQGEERFLGKGIHYCATCDGGFYRGKDIAVLGGGNSAVEEALYLSALCNSVTLIHRKSSLRANRILIQQMKAKKNIQFLTETMVISAEGTNSFDGVTVSEQGTTRFVPCSALFIAVGREPASSLFKNKIALDEYGYILTDEGMRTSLPGVFAAGDIRAKKLRQIVTATADGAIAAGSALEYLQ